MPEASPTNKIPDLDPPKEISKRNVAHVAQAKSFGMQQGENNENAIKRNVAHIAKLKSFGIVSPYWNKRNVAHMARLKSYGIVSPQHHFYGKRHYSSLLKEGPVSFGYNDFNKGLDPAADNWQQSKKNIGSLMQNRYNDIKRDYEPSDYYDYEYDDVSKDDVPEKRHIGSLISNRYSNGYSFPSYDKRYLASVVKSHPYYGNLYKKHIGSIMKKGATDFYLEHGGNENDFTYPADDFNDIETVKKHIGSFMRNHYQQRRMYKREADAMSFETPSTNKRHLSSLIQNGDLDKRHYSSLLQNGGYESNVKRYYSSLLKNIGTDPEKRHIASALNNNYDKRHYSSLLDNDGNIKKKHLASLIKSYNPYFEKRHYSSLLQNQYPPAEKKYFSSLLKSDLYDNQGYQKRLTPELQNEDEKRFFRTLLRDDTEEQKRHISSIRQGKRDDESDLEDPAYAEKRHLSSLMADKRHLASLQQYKKDEPYEEIKEKKHIASLRQDKKNSYDNNIDEEKRHIASLRQGKREGSFTAFDNDNKLEEEKRHIASLRNKKPADSNEERRLSDLKSLMLESSPMEEEEKKSYSSLLKSPSYGAPHNRKKRYIGALARSNNLPFRASRSLVNPYGRGYYGSYASFLDYVDNYIREQLNKASVRNHLRQSGKLDEILNEKEPSANDEVDYVIDNPEYDEPIEDDYSPNENHQSTEKRFIGK